MTKDARLECVRWEIEVEAETPLAAAEKALAAARALAYLCFVGTEKAAAIIFIAASCDAFAILVVTVAADPA